VVTVLLINSGTALYRYGSFILREKFNICGFVTVLSEIMQVRENLSPIAPFLK
jgi:hypothetical protein